jgi:hypothetical protein
VVEARAAVHRLGPFHASALGSIFGWRGPCENRRLASFRSDFSVAQKHLPVAAMLRFLNGRQRRIPVQNVNLTGKKS